LVPQELAVQLHEPLRRYFRDDPAIEVIVERRSLERRGKVDRRKAKSAPGAEERRLVHNLGGRRVGERRAPWVALDGATLPRRARRFADRVVFFERLEPSSQDIEDVDTARIITRIQAGERDAFAILYARYFDRVYGYLRATMRDPHETEEATQQVFFNVFEALANYEHRARFRGWLFTIARNHALNSLKRRGRTETLDMDDVESRKLGGSQPGLDALDWISDRELQMFLDRLPLIQRQVLYLRYAVGLRSSEMASVLGVTAEAVRQHQARATRFLRARLEAVGRAPTRSNRMGAHGLVLRPRVVRARRFSLIGSNPAG
jgi:RNA polymerase sigma-70 factor (ECF subfamily)